MTAMTALRYVAEEIGFFEQLRTALKPARSACTAKPEAGISWDAMRSAY